VEVQVEANPDQNRRPDDHDLVRLKFQHVDNEIMLVEQENNIVTITVKKGDKEYVYRIHVQSDKELDEKLRKIKRKVKWWGGLVVRVLVNRGKADSKLVRVIQKIIEK